MRLISSLIARSYDNNRYNIECRNNEISQQDREFITNGFEFMFFNTEVPKGSNFRPRILDLGCGAGFPYTRELATYGHVLGCDVSKQQVACARLNVPSAAFIQKDVMELKFMLKYDVITMFHSFFNIRPVDKPVLLRRMRYWLADHGVILITTYGDETRKKYKSDFHGAPMVWYHISTSDFKKLVAEAGLSIILHDCKVDESWKHETHLWILEKER